MISHSDRPKLTTIKDQTEWIIQKNHNRPHLGWAIGYTQDGDCVFGDNFEQVAAQIHDTEEFECYWMGEQIFRTTEKWSRPWQWIDKNKTMQGYFGSLEEAMAYIHEGQEDRIKDHAE